MIKNIYALYDDKVKGIPGEIFTDYNDETVKRGLQENQKNKPITRDVAQDLVLINLGKLDYQNDLLDNVKINSIESYVVGRLTDFLTFVE